MKKKLWILGLTTALIGCSVGGGMLMDVSEAAAEEGSGVTIGTFYADAGYVLNGTSSDVTVSKTTLSYKWDAAAYSRIAIEVTGVSASSSVELSFTSDADANVQLLLGNGQSDWTGVYGTPIALTQMTADVAFERTISLAGLEDATSFWLLIYFDPGIVTTETKTITVNTLSVDGVNYTPLTYEEQEEVAAPEFSFKEYTQWTATNGAVTANTLEALEGEAAAGAVDSGAGNFTITDVSQTAKLEIPLYEAISAWPNSWTHLWVKLKATNLSQINAYIESVESHTGEVEDAHAFCFGLLSAWNATVTNSVTDGYRMVDVNLGSYFTDYLNAHEGGTITKIVLVPVVKGDATEASVEFGGMVFGDSTAPTFINDIGNPELTIGEWTAANGGGYVVEQEGKLTLDDGTNYTGLKISYTNEQASAWAYVTAGISNFDPEVYPYLHLGFYTDSEIALGIWDNTGDLVGAGHATYEAGYHELDIDLSQKTYENGAMTIQFYLDSGVSVSFEGTKTVVFDDITFHKELSVAFTDATTNGLFNTPEYKDGKLSWTWDAKAAGAYYAVSIPVDNWYSFNRVLHLNVTLSHATALGVWGSNSFTDTTLNAVHPVLAAGTYDLWLSASTAGFVDGGVNNVMIYCDVNNASEASLIKTLTINKLEFLPAAEYTSSPNGNVITVDYIGQSVTFDATYEVATDEAFTAKLASGAAVTPGSVLYLRAANGASAVSAIVLPQTELTEATAPSATVGENFIRFGATGFEYKFGEDGEWVSLGSWGNLEADTEYTVYVRVKATETSFASDAVKLTIKTSAASTGTQTPGNETPPDPVDPPVEETKKGCGSALNGLVFVPIALAAAGVCILLLKKKS